MRLKYQLKKYLKDRDMTAAQLSRKTNISPSVISGWLGGTSPKDIKQVKAVADVFGITIDELCFGPIQIKEAPDNCLSCKNFLKGECITGIFEVKMRPLIQRPKIETDIETDIESDFKRDVESL